MQSKRIIYIILFLAAGFFWYKYNATTWLLPLNQEDKPQEITGEIVSIPIKNQTFNFHLHHPSRLIRLNWRGALPNLQVGDEWQLNVKLKRIHGAHNPGSFDYESWALQHGLGATGSVIKSPHNKKLTHHWYIHPIDQIRQHIQTQLLQHLPHSNTAHWLIALAIGERADIPQEQWQVLRHTGTNHLMAIGGLHIGMVAGVFYLLVNKLWRLKSKLLLKLPAQEAAACAALLIAWVYGSLSGFAIPAQRACIMLSVYTLAVLSRRKFNSWLVLMIAMLVVLIINPFSIFSESFWLSFGTIGLIIFGTSGRVAHVNALSSRAASGAGSSVVKDVKYQSIIKSRWIPRQKPRGMTAQWHWLTVFWHKYGRVQWVIGFGLIPLSLLFFQECSLTSFIANSIAIPWLGFLILPFCLLGTLFIFIIPALGDVLLMLADKGLVLLWKVLTWFSHYEFATWTQAMPSMLIFIITLCGVLLLITPLKFPARWLASIWFLPLILFKPALLNAGEAKLTLLDVGQGLSAVVQTRHHTLVFDAGPPTPTVVVPFLRTQFVKKIDMFVISHGDMDHIGGAADILRDMSVKQIATSVPEKFPKNVAALCLAGQHWQWDGVSFSFIYPFPDTLHLDNDSSCVLRVDAKNQSVLIPGDIEQFAETTLLERGAKLRATTLVAPHHGSHTSGLASFINAVYPRYVLYATGYHNRYHFPHPDIIESYKKLGTEAFDTAKLGAIQININ